MAENKSKITVYRDWVETFRFLSDEDAGKLIKHFFEYVNDKNPPDPTGIIGMAWIPIKSQLKRDLKKWEAVCERNRANANMRWHANASSGIPKDTKNADKDKDIYKNIIPTKEELAAYLKERGRYDARHEIWNKIQAWEANGWKDMNGKPILNWKGRVITQLRYVAKKDTQPNLPI